MIEAALNGSMGRTILGSTVVTIGSTLDNQLVVSNYSVSSHHAEIRSEERGYSITDLGSAYGTFVNDRRLDWNVPYLLNPGDTILIGDTKFTYEMRDVPQVESAPSSNPGPLSSPDLPPTLVDTSPPHTTYGSDLPQAYQPPAYPHYPTSIQPSYVPQSWSTTGIPSGELMGAPQEVPPAKRSRRGLWISLGIVGVVLLAGILVFFLVIRSTPDKTLDAFCNSMQKGDYQTAYGQFSSALQKMQSESQFASENKVTTCTHSSANQSGSTAMANLTTVSPSGTTLNGQVILVQDNNNNWKINVLPSTPSITLDAFCNALNTRDYQMAYNQLSSRVQNQNSELSFASSVAQSGIASCTHGTPVVSGNTATGSMTFVSSTGQTAPSIVTLVKEGNTWKIDNLS